VSPAALGGDSYAPEPTVILCGLRVRSPPSRCGVQEEASPLALCAGRLPSWVLCVRELRSLLSARSSYSKVTNALLYAYWFTRLSEWYPAPTSGLSCSHMMAICPLPAMSPDSSAELNV